MDSKLFYLTQEIEKIDDSIKHTFTWTIPDFMWLLNNQTNREIRTNKLEIKKDAHEVCKIQLKIKFVGHGNELIEIYYKTDKTLFENLQLRMETIPYSSNTSSICFGHTQASVDLLYTQTEPYQLVNNDEWHFLARLYKTKLIEKNTKSLIRSMKFQFEFNTFTHNSNLTKDLPHPLSENIEFGTSNINLKDDLSNLLMKKTASDVTVKSAEGATFHAHKIFLMARSAVLKAHFEHNTVEAVTNNIDTPFRTDVLKNILCYIYSDNAPNCDELAEELLQAADYYQLEGLKTISEAAMKNKLTVGNAIETLELAQSYKAPCLKRQTLEFIKDGSAEDIIETKRWKSIESAEIIKTVYEHVIKK